jgi:cellulose synthase/poly-beta-1,6-N-acetylglucosamine synthase-like glycosyltransferase
MILKTGKATGVLTYLNKKADRWTRHRIAELIGTTVRTDPWLREEYAIHATDEVLEALRMEREEPDRERGTRSGENVKASTLAVTVGAALFGPAALYVIASLAYTDFRPSLGGYVQVFSAAFGVYAFLLNCVYLALLVFAGVAIARQERRWSAKPKSFLFARGVLPSVSIIAPAFNEERTIVESVTALLSLRYPDYEVIVVNDGSLDETLSQLVDHFELVRADVFVHGYLRTQPVRGIYRNPRIPGLMVIDKSNGGKADSLNAGINAARKEYFAAIDSDSVLEPDSLLKLTAGFLDTDRPVVAAGGNILPANGCILDHGHLEQVRLPGRVLPRFQMIEYVRAFMTGRSGWAQLDALLIISGAFGVFRAAEVVDSRGYLTSSERYTKDTVAEDMELVVRVTRDLRRSGLPHAVQYAPAANCWTEVPESFRVLGAQRDRWQRGLIDVLFFHLAMLFNPRYGKAAFIALPYYYVFELFGPWIEFQGYILLIAGIASGTLPATLAAFVLVAAVPLSMLTSLASVLLVEWHTSIFKGGDRINLLILSVFENLGYRQYSNILRLRGFISALRRRTGWGLMKRRGFAAREGS